MNIESIPQENSDWKTLQEDLSRAMDALSSDDPLSTKLLGITNIANDREGIKVAEEYLKDNFNKLSQEQRNFLLISLRVKNYRLQSQSKHP